MSDAEQMKETIRALRAENERLKAWRNGTHVRNYREMRAYQDEAACLAKALRSMVLTIDTLLHPSSPPILHHVVRGALMTGELPSDQQAKRALESYDRLAAKPVDPE